MYSKKRKYGRSNLQPQKGKSFKKVSEVKWNYQTYTYFDSKDGRKRLVPKYIGKVGSQKELDRQRKVWDDFFDDMDYQFKNQNPFNKPPTPLTKIIQYYIESSEKKVSLNDMSESTLRFNRENIKIFRSWYLTEYGDKSVDRILTSEIDEYRTHRIQKGLSPNTISINLRNLRGFFNFCVKERYIDVSPFTKDIVIPKYKSRLTDEVLLNGDWKRFYKSIENTITHKKDVPSEILWFDKLDWFKGILWVMCNSGMRGGEVRILKWKKSPTDTQYKKVSYSHLDRELTKICIFFKGGYGEIPLEEPLKSFFTNLKKNKDKNIYVFQNPNREEGFGKDIFNKYFRELMKSLGWDGEGYKPHSIRHSVVSSLVKRDVNIYSISKLLRHTDIRTTLNIYGHLLPSDLGDIMKKIGVFND